QDRWDGSSSVWRAICTHLAGHVARTASLLFGFGVFLLSAPSTSVAKMPVDLELVLAVDASGSVDQREFQLQLAGIAAGFRDPEVQRAIASGELGRISVALMIWSDAMSKKAVSRWSVIDSQSSASAFADLVVSQLSRRKSFLGKGGTGIGSAIGRGVKMIRLNDFEGTRKVIDVSGDGHETPLRHGEGMALPEGKRRARRRGITVNGLAIETDNPNLTDYYRRKVIRGPGSFVIRASDYDDFSRAMKAKLLREIRVLTGEIDGSVTTRG
ncbi:MAG: DUF1194 domain-containing protein, partial [Pseudomonadota bacterium]